MDNTTQQQLFALFDRQKTLFLQRTKSLPLQDFDPEWLSPCQIGDVEEGKIQWSVSKRDEPIDFRNIEQALKIQLHPSISDFFCGAYAGGVPCLFNDHPIELIQPWNEADFNLLQENMIAHFLMQKRLKQPASMFIASCSDEMQVISIVNATGQVQLETLGKGSEAILAENLAEFLAALQPIVND